MYHLARSDRGGTSQLLHCFLQQWVVMEPFPPKGNLRLLGGKSIGDSGGTAPPAFDHQTCSCDPTRAGFLHVHPGRVLVAAPIMGRNWTLLGTAQGGPHRVFLSNSPLPRRISDRWQASSGARRNGTCRRRPNAISLSRANMAERSRRLQPSIGTVGTNTSMRREEPRPTRALASCGLGTSSPGQPEATCG